MNFYPHHIGDFNSRTRHLTRVERSVYRDAIELQYDTELPLNNDLDKLAKRLLCVSDEEKNALKSVLDEFFKQTDSGFVNDRCTREIEKYRLNTSAKARAGIASAALRKQKSTGVEQKSTGVTNQEPLTTNHKPVTNEMPDGFALFWSAYPKKTAKPAALKAFKAQKINGEIKTIIADIENKAAGDDWKKNGGQFIPNPATYLNQRRWEDQTGQKTSDIWAGAI